MGQGIYIFTVKTAQFAVKILGILTLSPSKALSEVGWDFRYMLACLGFCFRDLFSDSHLCGVYPLSHLQHDWLSGREQAKAVQFTQTLHASRILTDLSIKVNNV